MNLNIPDLKKNSQDYKNVRKYDIFTINGKQCIIKNVKDISSEVPYYVTNEELFDILNTCYSSIGYGGRSTMVYELYKSTAILQKKAL